jgi:RNA polymerase subunit RPABC4/transcription elongation factor Spt4
VSLYCPNCRVLVPEGSSSCRRCFPQDLACTQCNRMLPEGSTRCPACSAAVVPSRPEPVSTVTATSIDPSVLRALAEIPHAVSHMPAVPEVYQAGRHGVKAEVTIPAGDAQIMNELLQFVQILHGMAGRVNQFRGHTDQTRAIIKGMRTLATDIQEEIERRRGPQG